MMSTEERVSKLEGAYEQVDERLGDLRVEMRGLRSDVNIRIDETNRSIEGLAAGDRRDEQVHRGPSLRGE